MKQKDKNQISMDKIVNAAIVEFGKNGYDKASINNICNDNNISKGLIYHYFKNKDELFLFCVKLCFDSLVEYLVRENLKNENFHHDIIRYLDLRNKFFKENTYFSQIFFNVILQPPAHLKDRIKTSRKDFDDLNINNYKEALKKINLRDSVSEEEAVEFFYIFQEMFNSYFQLKAYENTDFESLIESHEIKLSKLLNIMLYGIAKETKKDDHN